MPNTKTMREYKFDEVVKKLGITGYTLNNWYRYEKKELLAGEIDKPYLPQPSRDNTAIGRPRIWTEEQVKQLKAYAKSVVVGRNGKFGKYSNPHHKTFDK